MTRELIEYVGRSLIDEPEAMTLTEIEENGVRIYRLQVAPRDIGKVIGRRGRVARSIRTLLKVASIHNHTRCVLEIE